MVTHTYLGNYPKNHTSNWSDKLQGVTHDSEHWFFTQKTKLLKFHVTTDLKAGSGKAVKIARMPKELENLGCDHFGDLDFFEWRGRGYLFIPVEGDDCCDHLPFLAVFRNDANLIYLGSSILPYQKKSLGTGRAGWCAINPLNQLLYSSSNRIDANHPIFRYEVDFDALRNGYVILKPHSEFVLQEQAGSSQPLKIPKYLQGGAFSPDGWLYLANGGASSDKKGGIRVFDPDGVLQDKSSLKSKPFKYEFHSSVDEEPEGLTFWDLDELGRTIQIPKIEGQLHAILLDNDAGDDDFYFKHYRLEKTEETDQIEELLTAEAGGSYG